MMWQFTTTSIGSVVDRGGIRFILKDIRAVKWKDYKKRVMRGKDIGYKKEYVNALETDQKPHSLWLVTDCIDLDNVEAIENTKTGKRDYLYCLGFIYRTVSDQTHRQESVWVFQKDNLLMDAITYYTNIKNTLISKKIYPIKTREIT